MNFSNVPRAEPMPTIFFIEIFPCFIGLLVVTLDNIVATNVNLSSRVRPVFDTIVSFFPVDKLDITAS
jgi:hypothetical protein